MRSLSFAGTAKNTGKTTACVQVMEDARAAGFKIGLTSIGYDGEMKDNVTGLPKPRYVLQPGDWIATAEKCLRSGTAETRVQTGTGINTVLGEIVLAQVLQPGLVVLAGPNRRSDVVSVLEHFVGAGVDLALVDGALNRIVPMIASDGLVLSTGAALDTDIALVAKQMGAISRLFRLECLVQYPEGAIEPENGSLLSRQGLAELARKLDRRVETLCIPNACDPYLLAELFKLYPAQLQKTRLVFGNPLKLIASADARLWADFFATLATPPLLLENLPLLLVTVNPFYPRFLPGYYTYEPAMVDKAALLGAVRESVPDFQVVDIKQAGTPDLLSLLGLRISAAEAACSCAQ